MRYGQGGQQRAGGLRGLFGRALGARGLGGHATLLLVGWRFSARARGRHSMIATPSVARYGLRWRPATLWPAVPAACSAAALEVQRVLARQQRALQDRLVRRHVDVQAGSRAAMSAAATSACCAASPPCLKTRVVMSPTAQTPGTSARGRTRPPARSRRPSPAAREAPARTGAAGRPRGRPRAAPRAPARAGPRRIPGRSVPVRRCTPRRDEPARDRGAGVRPEDVERIGLARDELEVEVEPAAAPVLGGLERQLVQRQRPRDAGARDERDPMAAAGLEGLERLADRQHVARAGERQRARQRRLGPRAEREQQRVVAHGAGPSRVTTSCVSGRTASTVSGIQRTPRSRAMLLPLEARRRIAAERLGDGERAVGQMARGGQHADAQPVARERLQGEQRLERSDASARDHDVWIHVHSVGHGGPAAIGDRGRKAP